MIVQGVAAIITTLGFGIIFNVRGKNLIYTAISGGMGWIIYLFGKDFGLSDGINYFIATLFIAIYCEVISKKTMTPTITILIPALIPLAPGGGIYYTIYNLIERNYPMAVEKGISTFIIAGAMALGIYAATNIVKILTDKFN